MSEPSKLFLEFVVEPNSQIYRRHPLVGFHFGPRFLFYFNS
jgi:hypothetical protein